MKIKQEEDINHMRKYQKTQCLETMKLLAEAHAEIAKYIERKQARPFPFWNNVSREQSASAR